MKKVLTLLLLCFSVTTSYAYNSNGHKVIAQIAYDNLTPEVQGQVTTLIGVVGQYYAIATLVEGAPWADWLKGNNVTAYNTWHYTDQPIIVTPCVHCQVSDPEPENVVWAITQAQQVLMTPNSTHYPQESSFEKSEFLLFFEHFVGDIHQPLHTVSLYSTAFPTGDKGGNLYKIHSDIASNLHAFWDCGAGIFPSENLDDNHIKALAAAIEKAYPQESLSAQVSDLTPSDWAADGKKMAENFVYTVPMNGTPSTAYIHTARELSENRLRWRATEWQLC